MREKLQEQKERTIAAMTEEIERYYEELSQGSEDPACDINGFEKMMVAHQKRTDEIFLKAVCDAVSSVEAEVIKKM